MSFVYPEHLPRQGEIHTAEDVRRATREFWRALRNLRGPNFRGNLNATAHDGTFETAVYGRSWRRVVAYDNGMLDTAGYGGAGGEVRATEGWVPVPGLTVTFTLTRPRNIHVAYNLQHDSGGTDWPDDPLAFAVHGVRINNNIVATLSSGDPDFEGTAEWYEPGVSGMSDVVQRTGLRRLPAGEHKVDVVVKVVRGYEVPEQVNPAKAYVPFGVLRVRELP